MKKTTISVLLGALALFGTWGCGMAPQSTATDEQAIDAQSLNVESVVGVASVDFEDDGADDEDLEPGLATMGTVAVSASDRAYSAISELCAFTPKIRSGRWAIASDEKYIYVANGINGLEIWEKAKENGKLTVAFKSTYKFDKYTICRGLLLTKKVLYMSDRNRIHILKVSDGTVQRISTVYFKKGFAYKLALKDNVLFVAATGGGVVAIDVSDLYQPKVISTVLAGPAREINVVNDLAYAADLGQGLVILNVADPKAMKKVGQFKLAKNFAVGVHVEKNIAYVADRWNGLLAVDISSPAHPTLLAQFPEAKGYDIVLSREMLLYTAAYNGMYVVNVSNPVAPVLVEKISRPGRGLFMDTAEKTLYLAGPQAVVMALAPQRPAQPEKPITEPKEAADKDKKVPEVSMPDKPTKNELPSASPETPEKSGSDKAQKTPAAGHK